MNISEIKQDIGDKIGYLKENFYVREINVFGSFVKGLQDAGSDLDILVSFEKGYKDFFNYMRLKFCLEEFLGRKVNLVMKEAVKPRLREKILSEVEYV